MNKQQHYITMDRDYNSSANRKTTMCKPMNKASSRLTLTTSQDSRLLFNPGGGNIYICTTHNAFTITSSWPLVITTPCCLHWTQYPLMYCHNCTLLSLFGSTISWYTVITAHCNLKLDLLSGSVLPIITGHYYPLSAGVIQVLYTVILYGSTISRCTTITAHCNRHCKSLISCSTDIMAHCYPHMDIL